jgi:hypothetical protein
MLHAVGYNPAEGSSGGLSKVVRGGVGPVVAAYKAYQALKAATPALQSLPGIQATGSMPTLSFPGATGTLDLSAPAMSGALPAAAEGLYAGMPAAAASISPAAASMISGGGVTGLDTLLAAKTGATPLLGGSFMSAALASPFFYAAALPALFTGLRKLAGSKPHDPLGAIETQFGTRAPSDKQMNSYFEDPDTRRVALMDLLSGFSVLGRNKQALDTLGEAGFWDTKNKRWSDKSVPWTVGGISPADYGINAPPDMYDTWQAYNDYAKTLEDKHLVARRNRQKQLPQTPWYVGLG